MKRNFTYTIMSLLMISGFCLSGCMNSTKVDDKFNNSVFKTKEFTRMGTSYKNSIYFDCKEATNFENKVELTNQRTGSDGKTWLNSGLTKGTWRWSDSLNRIIEIQFEAGLNNDKSGKWEFSTDFESLNKVDDKGEWTTYFKESKDN